MAVRLGRRYDISRAASSRGMDGDAVVIQTIRADLQGRRRRDQLVTVQRKHQVTERRVVGAIDPECLQRLLDGSRVRVLILIFPALGDDLDDLVD